jgi:hypothetical protein
LHFNLANWKTQITLYTKTQLILPYLQADLEAYDVTTDPYINLRPLQQPDIAIFGNRTGRQTMNQQASSQAEESSQINDTFATSNRTGVQTRLRQQTSA